MNSGQDEVWEQPRYARLPGRDLGIVWDGDKDTDINRIGMYEQQNAALDGPKYESRETEKPKGKEVALSQISAEPRLVRRLQYGDQDEIKKTVQIHTTWVSNSTIPSSPLRQIIRPPPSHSSSSSAPSKALSPLPLSLILHPSPLARGDISSAPC